MLLSAEMGYSTPQCSTVPGLCFFGASLSGGTDLFGGKLPEAIGMAAEDRNKQLMFQAAVKPAAKGAAAPPRPPRSQQRGGFRKRKGQTRAPAQTTHKRPKHQGTLSRQVSRGRGAKLGVTATWTNKPKV